MRVEKVRDAEGKILNYIVVDENFQEVREITDFINFLRLKNYSPNTLVNYTYDLRICFEYFVEVINKKCTEISPKDMIGLVEHLSNISHKYKENNVITFNDICNGANKSGKLSPTTINRMLAATSSFFDWLNLTEMITNNPLIDVVDYKAVPVNDSFKGFMAHTRKNNQNRSRFLKIKTSKPLPRPINPDTTKIIIESLRTNRDKSILLLGLQGGLRIGEILGIKFEDINFRKKEISVIFREDNPNGSRVKGSKDRIVQIYETESLTALNDYILYERPESDSDYVFLSNKGKTKGKPLTYQGINTIFNYYCNKLNLKPLGSTLTIHSLRHTHATNMYDGGMGILTLQKRLGHSSPQTTSVYTKISDEKVKGEYQNAINSKEIRDK